MPINRAAVGAIAGYVEDQRKRREEAYKSDQEFQQRLLAAGIAAGRLEPIIQGGRITGVQPTATFDPSALGPGQTYSQRVGGGTLMSRGASLAEQTYANKLGMASALAPLPTVTPPGGFEQEGFAPSEIGHPQMQRLLRNRLGAMQQVGLSPRPPASLRPKTPTDAQAFRDAVQKAIAAVSAGILSKEEALQALIDDHPTRVDAIRRLEYELF